MAALHLHLGTLDEMLMQQHVPQINSDLLSLFDDMIGRY